MIFFIPEGSKLRGSLLSCFKYQQLSGGGGSRSGYYSTSSGGGSGNSFYQASAYERAKSSGQSSYNWFNSKLKEAGNIWNSWTKGMEKTVKHFCTTANRIKKGTNEFLKNIDQKNLSGLAGIFNTIGTKTWGKLINKITDNNRTEKEVFDLVKNPVGRYFAFEYDKAHDYYKTNETYGVQRYGGFTDLYDALGGFLGMDLDTKIVYYKANGVNYRLQFWKGSYGFGNAYGGEIGLYSNTNGGAWYQTVSGNDEIQTEQYIRDKKTNTQLIHNNTADYATNGDHYWNLAIKTDSGRTKENLIQESYLVYDDPIKRKAALKALQRTSGIKAEEFGENKIRVIY